jgi:hypothetical protein
MPKKPDAAAIVTQLINKQPNKIPLGQVTRLVNPSPPLMSPALLEKIRK